MRQQAIAYAVIRPISWLVALLVSVPVFVLGPACSDHPYDPGGPAVDPEAPRIHIASPERGTFAGNVFKVEVTGTTLDDTGVTSVVINGVAATVRSDGSFTASVPVSPGTNLLHAVAKDAQGNTGKETRAVVAGPMKSLDRSVPSAITAVLSTQTFEAIGRGAGAFIQSADLGALVQPLNPVVDVGPACANAQARIVAMDVGAAQVALVPQGGGLGFDVTLDDVSVRLRLQWSALCFDGSREVTVAASRLRVRALLAVGIAEGGGFSIAMRDPDVQLTGLDLDLGGIPGSIVEALDLDTRLGPVLAFATERLVVPLLNRALSGLDQTQTVDVLGKSIDITVAPTRIDFDVTGAIVVLDTELRARGDGGAPGFVFVGNTVPAMDRGHGFQLAIADDAANQLLASFWGAGGMEAGIDLSTGPYGDVGQLYDRVELSAKLPPFIDASGTGLRLTVGDLMATFRDGSSVATQIAVNGTLELKVLTGPDGALRLDVGTPTTHIDILDEGVDGANQLSNAQFESITSFALSRLVAFGSSAVGAIPLPAAGEVGVHNVTIGEQTGYVVVDGEVE